MDYADLLFRALQFLVFLWLLEKLQRIQNGVDAIRQELLVDDDDGTDGDGERSVSPKAPVKLRRVS